MGFSIFKYYTRFLQDEQDEHDLQDEHGFSLK